MSTEPELWGTPGGFGGLFLADGYANVWLVDPSQAEAARAFVEPVLKRLLVRRDPGPALRFLQARYECRQLRSWSRALMAAVNTDPPTNRALALDGLDERRNAVYLGVVTRPAAERVRAHADALGIPEAALIVELVSRPNAHPEYPTRRAPEQRRPGG